MFWQTQKGFVDLVWRKRDENCSWVRRRHFLDLVENALVVNIDAQVIHDALLSAADLVSVGIHMLNQSTQNREWEPAASPTAAEGVRFLNILVVQKAPE